ncbi:DNA repair exonuclease [Jaminaea rosea]|uniref:Double-strand break repair protein n=1 Tax=Jaminaea rosea TaxID=1569628 RepID=A0A316UQ93_9BASI|nr:DNA repair exonuclease [Jaminaea rosea]PWN27482.1 DNA repair exonuclease [Jaminaea rosea]
MSLPGRCGGEEEQVEGTQEGPSEFTPRVEANHLKILLATDNHIGYMERDPVRGQDSINAFREILKIAVERDVDMILLGGDLFHENKPSRSTLHQVMASLRQYCLSDRPVTIELLSDPNDGRAEGYNFPAINYEDPNLNVGIPVFSIHGNHDDPQGVGAEGALSALDVLSVSGLVNYFGKVELPTDDDIASKPSKSAPDAGGLSDVGIRIRPVLLQKGDTKLALYGMGNIKDERMHYELRSNRVRMYRPRESPDEWFNILCIHQNRAAHNPKACVPETMFDDSVHLVIWGHEHEQRIRPQAVGGKQYHITQPGSSVATSLSPGEAEEKMIAIIHVENTDYYLEEIPLQSVRPFIMDDMVLKDEAEDANVDLKDKGAVQKLLRDRVSELIARAEEEWETKFEGVPPEERPHGDRGRGGRMMLPLVRLRVEYDADIELGNVIRFGQEFVDRVANPRDVLHFSKKKLPRTQKDRQAAQARKDGRYAYVGLDDILPPEGDDDDDGSGDPHKVSKVKIGNLVKTALQGQNLELLNPDGLEKAITSYVDKNDRDAIQHFVKGMVRTFQGQLNSLAPDEGMLDQELDRIRDEAYRNRRGGDSDAEEDDEEQGGRGNAAKKGKGGAASNGKKGASAAASSSRRRAEQDSDDSMLDDGDDHGGGFSDMDDDEAAGGSRSRTPSTSAAASSSRPSRANATFLGQDDSDVDMASEDNGGDSEFEDSAPPRRGAASSTRKTPATSNGATPARATKKGSTTAASRNKASGSAAASKGRAAGRAASRDESPGFEVDEELSQPAVRGGGAGVADAEI